MCVSLPESGWAGGGGERGSGGQEGWREEGRRRGGHGFPPEKAARPPSTHIPHRVAQHSHTQSVLSSCQSSANAVHTHKDSSALKREGELAARSPFQATSPPSAENPPARPRSAARPIRQRRHAPSSGPRGRAPLAPGRPAAAGASHFLCAFGEQGEGATEGNRPSLSLTRSLSRARHRPMAALHRAPGDQLDPQALSGGGAAGEQQQPWLRPHPPVAEEGRRGVPASVRARQLQ
jgi:hypothetical protein